MTAQTPVFGIKYPVVGEPIRTTRQILEDNAKATEAALLAGPASPPGASDLLAVSGRVSVLEAVLAPTAPTFTAGWAAYTDATVPWAGVRYWGTGKARTMAGAISATSARPNGDVICTLPTGSRPPVTLQVATFAGSAFSLVLTAAGQLKLSGSAASGAVTSFTVNWLATQ